MSPPSRRAARALPKSARVGPPGLEALAESLKYDLPRIQAKLERWGVDALGNDELLLARLLGEATEVEA